MSSPIVYNYTKTDFQSQFKNKKNNKKNPLNWELKKIISTPIMDKYNKSDFRCQFLFYLFFCI